MDIKAEAAVELWGQAWTVDDIAKALSKPKKWVKEVLGLTPEFEEMLKRANELGEKDDWDNPELKHLSKILSAKGYLFDNVCLRFVRVFH